MSINSNLSEPLGNDPNVVYPLGIVPPNFNASTHGNAPRTSSTFLKNIISGKFPNTYINGNAPNNNGNALLPHLNFFVILQKETQINRQNIKLEKHK